MLFKLRNYLFVFFVCTSMILYWPVPVLAGLLFSDRKAHNCAVYWGYFILWLIKVVLGVKCNVVGKENVPQKACVVLSKHQSAMDIFVLLPLVTPQSWVMKREIFKIPCFGWVLMASKPIAIDRSSARKALMFVIKQGIEKIKQGYSIVLYPEGTRSFPGEKIPYKSGGVSLAKRAEVDILPIAHNTGLFWQKGKGAINTGTVEIVIGKPIDTKEKDVEELTNMVEEWIEEQADKITLTHPHYITMKQSGLLPEDS